MTHYLKLQNFEAALGREAYNLCTTGFSFFLSIQISFETIFLIFWAASEFAHLSSAVPWHALLLAYSPKAGGPTCLGHSYHLPFPTFEHHRQSDCVLQYWTNDEGARFLKGNQDTRSGNISWNTNNFTETEEDRAEHHPCWSCGVEIVLEVNENK